MDKVAASGAADTGSIPVWDANNREARDRGLLFVFNFCAWHENQLTRQKSRIVPGTKINLLSVTASQSVGATLKLISSICIKSIVFNIRLKET